MLVVEDLDDASRPRSLGCREWDIFPRATGVQIWGRSTYLSDVQGSAKKPDWLTRLPLHQSQCLGRLANERPNNEHNRGILGGCVVVQSVVLRSHLDWRFS